MSEKRERPAIALEAMRKSFGACRSEGGANIRIR
jgi:hypothetical protein